MVFLHSLSFCHRVSGFLKNPSYSVDVFWEVVSTDGTTVCAYCGVPTKAQKPKILTLETKHKPQKVTDADVRSRCLTILAPQVRQHTACANCSALQEQNINNQLNRIV